MGRRIWGRGCAVGRTLRPCHLQVSQELGFLSFAFIEGSQGKEEGAGVDGMADPHPSLFSGGSVCGLRLRTDLSSGSGFRREAELKSGQQAFVLLGRTVQPVI